MVRGKISLLFFIIITNLTLFIYSIEHERNNLIQKNNKTHISFHSLFPASTIKTARALTMILWSQSKKNNSETNNNQKPQHISPFFIDILYKLHTTSDNLITEINILSASNQQRAQQIIYDAHFLAVIMKKIYNILLSNTYLMQDHFLSAAHITIQRIIEKFENLK